jgi:hypothetical protein
VRRVESVENAESAGRSGERELVDRVRARGGQSVEALGGKIFGGIFRAGACGDVDVRA